MAGWKKELQVFGTVRAKSMAQMADDYVPPEDRKKQRQKKRYNRKEKIAGYLTKEAADVCLNCKRKECFGSDECFRKHRKEMKANEKQVPASVGHT